MNCREFERVWNGRLDCRAPATAADEPALEAHAAACSSCRAVATRYRTLQTAIGALRPLPSPPADFADRVLTEIGQPVAQGNPIAGRLFTLRARPARLAAAASVLLAALLALRFGGGGPPARKPAPKPEPARVVRAIDPHALGNALATATSATLELARETSGPAARIGREVLVSARPALPHASAELSLAVGVEPDASSVLPSVGDRIQDGVKPFSGAARSAFGFLLAPTAGG